MIRSRAARLSGAIVNLLRQRKGAVALLVAALFPASLAVGLLGIDGSRVFFHKLLLRQTAQAASLAGANKLATYYTSQPNSSDQIVAAAQQFATANMPTAQYGTVVPAANVTLGTWDLTNKTFTAVTGTGGTPNAVQVVAALTGANAVPTLFGSSFGTTSVPISATAISSYATGKAFHVIMVNDLSGSFSSSISNQRAADTAILDCVKNSAGPTSHYGIVGFTGYSQLTQAPIAAQANYSALKTKINAVRSCGNAGAPPCSGSNAAAGIYRATKAYSDGWATYADTNMNIVVITDGVPNANSMTYGMNEGAYPTPTSATPTCTTACTDANLWTMATNQANYASSLGINVSTIYYSGNTSGSLKATYAAQLAQLRKGTGISLTAPTTAAINASFAAFCATMSSKLMAIY